MRRERGNGVTKLDIQRYLECSGKSDGCNPCGECHVVLGKNSGTNFQGMWNMAGQYCNGSNGKACELFSGSDKWLWPSSIPKDFNHPSLYCVNSEGETVLNKKAYDQWKDLQRARGYSDQKIEEMELPTMVLTNNLPSIGVVS